MARKAASSLTRLAASLSRFGTNADGIAATEAVLVLPIGLALLGLITLGGQGFEIQRKVTLASRTITDLVCQAALPTSGTNSSAATLNQSSLDYYLSLSALILYPNPGSAVQAEVSEIKLAPNGASTATVVWSEGYNGGAPRTVGQVLAINSSIAAAGASYLILGEVQYTFQPLAVTQSASQMTLSDSMFMSPRAAASVSINWGQ